jgi:putative serine protease PepD
MGDAPVGNDWNWSSAPPATPPTSELPRPPIVATVPSAEPAAAEPVAAQPNTAEPVPAAPAPPGNVVTGEVPPVEWVGNAPGGYVPPPSPPAYPPHVLAPPPVPPPSSPAPAPAGRDRGRRAGAAIAVAVALVAGGFAVARATVDDSSPAASTNTTTKDGSVQTVSTLVDSSTEPVAAVASVVAPAVVQIETRQGLGSGVVYDDEGHILTAGHVVDGATNVTVRTAAGAVLDGTVVGSSSDFDVAVVKVNPSDAPDGSLKPATLALNVPLQVGQLAVAIGSPFGLDQTVTSGIVSAIDRPVETPSGAIGMIQTDAPINPGNSGGALADRGGRIIGINDSIASASGGNEGVGFAIPIDVAKSVADRLVAGQPIEYAFLGVELRDAAGNQGGALVAAVSPDSPADDAGLQQGDVVTAIDGHPVLAATDLIAAIRSSKPGDTVTLHVQRGGSEKDLTVTLTANHN